MRNVKVIILLLACVFGFTSVHAQQKVAGTVYTDEAASVVWPFDSTTDYESYTATPEDGFSAASVDIGDATITGTGTRTADSEISGVKFLKLQPANGATDEVSWYVKPAAGLTFTPTVVSAYIQRFGTDVSSGVTVYGTSADGTKVSLGTFTAPRANQTADVDKYASNDDYTHQFVIELTEEQQAAFASEDGFTLSATIGTSSSKEGGFSQVTIEGLLNGTIEDVNYYTLTTAISPSEAGSIDVSPKATQYEEGTSITATMTENFGYHLAYWTDSEGDILSEDNPYTFDIESDLELIAVCTQNNVYALNLTLEGGANDNLVTFTPEGNVVDGVHYYEEGTDVVLAASDNRIITFTNWEDNTTNSSREITMDEEKNVTATFSACDYIVGWDLYYDSPTQDRSADYKDESDNAGLLSVRNLSGETTSWLALGVEKGGQNGKYGARIWKLLSAYWYFEISFSSVGYSNLILSAAIGDDYNTYATIYAQYSTDGENYTTFGTYEPPYRGWDEEEFELPEETDNQERVYIRFYPDYDGDMVGVESDYDGTSVAEIFILADKDTSSDDTPPTLVSSIPEDGSDGASASGSILLTFDEKIKIGEGDAMLGDEVLDPIISGKCVVYKYTGLDYATEYTFTVPEGAIVDRNGNAFEGATITFTTMERTQPDAKLFDAIVASDGSGDYTSLQDAIDAAPTERTKPWLIFVKNGEYEEHINIPATKPYMHIIGQDRDKTIIMDDLLCGGDNAVSTSEGATVVVRSDDCFFENITLENSWGHEQKAGPQALALNTLGDRTIFNNVALLSYQDTWITPSTSTYRAYVKNSLIEGAVDFIYNSGDIYLEGDTLLINRTSGGYIVAPSHSLDVEWGYVFNNCVITAEGVPSETDVWLGRPWHNYPKTVYLNTRAEVTIPATGWYPTMGGLPVLWADWNTTDADGNLLDLSQRRSTYYYIEDNDTVWGTAKNYLTDEEAAEYTVKNVLTGSDSWQPAIKTEACEVPSVVSGEGVISWAIVPYAICYVVTKGDEVVDITMETSCAIEDDASAYSVQAVNEYGGLSGKGSTSSSSGIEVIEFSPAAEPVSQTIYTMNGMQVSSFIRGINIVRTIDAEGNMTTSKVMR